MLSPTRTPLRALALLLFSSAAQAAGFCSSLPELHKKVNFCDDNYDYVAPAEECLENYRAHVKAKNEEIRLLLEKDLARATWPAQKQQFDTTKDVYKTADETLAGLIALGLQVHAELLAYEQDFVPPETPWTRPRSPFDYVHDPKHRQEFIELEGCYAAPILKVDGAMDEVNRMVGELKGTRKDTASLHKSTSGRDDNLGVLAKTTPLGGIKVVKGGRSPRSHSDITGIAEDKLKEMSLEQGNSAPAARKIASISPASGLALPVARENSMEREPSLDEVLEGAAADLAATMNGAKPEAELEKINLSESATQEASKEKQLFAEEAGMAFMESEPGVKLLSQWEVADLLKSKFDKSGALVSQLVGDESLFVRVHKRYRASGLFPYP